MGKIMQNIKRDFERIVIRFNDYGQYVRNSDSLNFKETLREFYYFIENTDLISDITKKLREYPDSKVDEWYGSFLASRRGMGGKAELRLPDREEERLFILYKIFSRINEGKLDAYQMGYPLSFSTNVSGTISELVSKLFDPMFTLFTYKLQEIDDEIADNTQPVTKAIYLTIIDRSIHIHGNVNNSIIFSGDNNMITKKDIHQKLEQLKSDSELSTFDSVKRKEIGEAIDELIKASENNKSQAELETKIAILVKLWKGAKKKLEEIITQIPISLASEIIILAIKHYLGIQTPL